MRQLKYLKIPLLSKTITRRIEEMSDDIKSQLIEYFHECKEEASGAWALQTDESKDISGKLQLLSSLRFIKEEKS